MVEALKKNPSWKGRKGPVVLVIMDGVGYGKYAEGDAVADADPELGERVRELGGLVADLGEARFARFLAGPGDDLGFREHSAAVLDHSGDQEISVLHCRLDHAFSFGNCRTYEVPPEFLNMGQFTHPVR